MAEYLKSVRREAAKHALEIRVGCGEDPKHCCGYNLAFAELGHALGLGRFGGAAQIDKSISIDSVWPREKNARRENAAPRM